MPTQSEDIRFGESSEVKVMKELETMLGEPLTRHGGFSIMDFSNSSKTIYAELKTRRCGYGTYPSVLIGANKVDFCKDPSKEYYFVFCFSNGTYYIKYSDIVFKTFKRDNCFVRGSRTDCEDKQQAVLHIPISLLSPLSSSAPRSPKTSSA